MTTALSWDGGMNVSMSIEDDILAYATMHSELIQSYDDGIFMCKIN